MAATVPSLEAPEFKDPPAPQFYSASEFEGHYGSGMLSPYGEQFLWIIQSLVESNGVVDGATLLSSLVAWAQTYTGRPDSALKAVVEAVTKHEEPFPTAGANDDQAHCFLKTLPVTCLYAGKPELRDRVEQVVRVHQNNDTAVAFGVATALWLEYILLHGKIPQNDDDWTAIITKDMPKAAQEAWQRAAATTTDLESLILDLSHEIMKGKEDSPFYDLAARSCQLPGSFIIPVYLLQKYGDADDAYVTAIRQNILGAGDTCSRAILLGGILGAMGHEPPASWIEKVNKDTLQQIDNLVEKFADMATAMREKDEL